ncbi:MAG: metallophosphatase family protein [Bernardetiaceae bacterium]|jgi:hypothetical protein|nr:metallophosphatase family protein [Bernardetiaceae bacterium]
MRIGLLSDTHHYLDPRVLDYFALCDEIWHAGDIGSLAVAETLAQAKPLLAVYGNIDGHEVRRAYPEHQIFERHGLRVWITHIGGYPPNYTPALRRRLAELRPHLFVCGHSHILKVVPDPTRQLLHLNPGAAGQEGFHAVRTLLRFEIVEAAPANAPLSTRLQNLEVIELGKRGRG